MRERHRKLNQPQHAHGRCRPHNIPRLSVPQRFIVGNPPHPPQISSTRVLGSYLSCSKSAGCALKIRSESCFGQAPLPPPMLIYGTLPLQSWLHYHFPTLTFPRCGPATGSETMRLLSVFGDARRSHRIRMMCLLFPWRAALLHRYYW